MKSMKKHLAFTVALSFAAIAPSWAEIVERELPKEWDGLVQGSRFIDRFLPLPDVGELSSDVWGLEGVKPRHLNNGLEDPEWSYWGGNIHIDEQGQHHLFVCRWREDDPKGHMAWPRSEVVHAVSDNSIGPYKVAQVVGPGHNPEMQQLKDGRYFLYVHKFSDFYYYLAEDLSGPWQKKPFTYDTRQRELVDHMSNNTFTQREDGSMLMVGRGGGVWISESGLPPYNLVSTQTVYPPYDGRYEDPVVWKSDVQYHLIVNDWLGRVAYYMRSKDGFNWKLDPGAAYLPGIAKHQDGRVEDWYKFERIKVLQDQYGRAYQANFAVNDTVKKQDMGSDNHSSKNISIPLRVGRLLEFLSPQQISTDTAEISLLVKAEPGFDPQEDIDLSSLRFGASEEVNFGRGSKVLKTTEQGEDLVITFAGEGHGFTSDNFAAKLLGKTNQGEPLFGFARLPWVEYQLPHLSSKFPEFSLNAKSLKAEIEIENFGQAPAKATTVNIEYQKDGQWQLFAKGKVPELKPYEKTTLTLWGQKIQERLNKVNVRITLPQVDQPSAVLEGPVMVY
ncbi:glycoside hydrolase family protein [Paraglaciecola sp. L3A3]|uniref:glycoside hydrolase family protein n=1 Tax=Paraglaciecola sp. L3A3 TaxID=2686358 RepID=UPI0018EEDEEE|nr:glycoside hydrolase family protein [Paraglaciecola sp. L3A3]